MMSVLVKKWLVSPCDKEQAALIAQEHSLNPFAALLAVSRGITEPEDIDAFFDSDNDFLCDPFELIDMEPAVNRLSRAIAEHERIAVFGDYDADGVTATALVCSYLETKSANFFHYIPNRLSEGYGLSLAIVDKLHEAGANLILTVDNGISSIDETEYANSLGMEVIITDHHIVGKELPPAVAVVDPHRPDCPSEFKDYAGVGVAFKLICALEGGDDDEMLESYSDLAAIGTIGDIVPVVGENRIIVSRGIRALNENTRLGIKALRTAASCDNKPLTSTGVAFTIAPRLNAAGRMGNACRAFELLLCKDEDDAQSLAQEIDEANTLRQQTELEISSLVLEQLRENPTLRYDRVIVCSGEGWHGGVVGIVASRIADKTGRPCILISSDGEISKGSGRSLEGFSLFDALESCSGCLEAFGGHTLAAGLTIKTDRIDEFRRAINAYAAKCDMPFPVQKIDFRLNPKSISTDILQALTMMEPFGASNPKPVFGLYKMKLEKITPVSGGKHLRLNFTRGDTRITAMSFGTPDEGFPYVPGNIVDLAVTLDANEYMGEQRVNIYIKAMRFSGFDEDGVLRGIRDYESFRRGGTPKEEGTAELSENGENAASAEAEMLAELIPTRESMGEIYRYIKSKGGWKRGKQALCAETGHTGEDVCTVLLVLDIMKELNLISTQGKDFITINKVSDKVNIENSEILQRAKGLM